MTLTLTGMAERVWDALGTVRDPELDEPVTTLNFVASCATTGDTAEVHLRLPTYFCAPNFAFLMVADAYDAVSAVPGVAHVTVVLDDHFAADQINAGVAARAGFVASFGTDQAADELDTLRANFVRKAVSAGTDRVLRHRLRAGAAPAELAALTLGELEPSADLDGLRARRRELGLPAGDGDPVLIDVETGLAVDPTDATTVRLHLGKARLSRVNIEANGSICRGMLQHRYPSSAPLPLSAIASEED
jgi:metal-sulfur cluster biosynthetic enzyme